MVNGNRPAREFLRKAVRLALMSERSRMNLVSGSRR